MTKVCILKGGISSEREVSLTSGDGIEKALIEKGFDVESYDYQDGGKLLDYLKDKNYDVFFNALHGGEGEDGRVSKLLELLGVSYTHSTALACSTAMDKERTKIIAKGLGIDVPDGFILYDVNLDDLEIYPAVVKPLDEGSSVGVHIVKDLNEWKVLQKELDKSKNWMVEEFIPGLELTTAVVFDEALTVTELKSSVEFYDYKAKYTEGVTEHKLPAELPKDIFEKCKEWSLIIHNKLGCKQVSRSDFRYDEENNRLVFLEVNTHPGMTPLSLLPEQVKYSLKMSYADFCEKLIVDALSK